MHDLCVGWDWAIIWQDGHILASEQLLGISTASSPQFRGPFEQAMPEPFIMQGHKDRRRRSDFARKKRPYKHKGETIYLPCVFSTHMSEIWAYLKAHHKTLFSALWNASCSVRSIDWILKSQKLAIMSFWVISELLPWQWSMGSKI